MFPQIRRGFQHAILLLLIVVSVAGSQPLEDEDGFVGVGEYPWEGWNGPLGDGLYGLRFGTGGFEVNATMREKGLDPSHSRLGTLRFEGDVLGANAELLAEFTADRTIDPGSQLRAIQIRWLLRGLPQQGMRLFGQLDEMLALRYGNPVLAEDDGLAALENGGGAMRRLYYGPEARAWLELEAQGRQRYALLIRIECPQLPRPTQD
jgi:hypothetical protein